MKKEDLQPEQSNLASNIVGLCQRQQYNINMFTTNMSLFEFLLSLFRDHFVENLRKNFVAFTFGAQAIRCTT